MERLKKTLENLNSMLEDLDIALKKLDRARNNPNTYDQNDIKAYRNSAIKSFEISFELFWKTLKAYLDAYHGISLASPKGIIHQCEKQKLLSNDETRLLLVMADVRNVTIHDYGRDMAEEMSRKIPAYYEIMVEIKARLASPPNQNSD